VELVVDEALLDPQVKEGDESGVGGGGQSLKNKFLKVFIK